MTPETRASLGVKTKGLERSVGRRRVELEGVRERQCLAEPRGSLRLVT